MAAKKGTRKAKRTAKAKSAGKPTNVIPAAAAKGITKHVNAINGLLAKFGPKT